MHPHQTSNFKLQKFKKKILAKEAKNKCGENKENFLKTKLALNAVNFGKL